MRNQLLVLCLVVSGCSFDIKTCTTDDDCVAGGYCGEGGFCVAREEQTGGGAGGGGGAQTTGGGTQVGGGSTTGGGDPTGGGGTSGLCDGGCPVWEECTSDAVCVDIGLELSWTTPDGGSRFGPNQTVPLKLSVSRADGGALPVSIPFALIGTTTSSLAGPGYVGSVQLTNASGTKTLWAGWDGGPSTTTTFDIDSTPPDLEFATDAGYHQRDEVIYGILRATDSIADSGVVLGGVEARRVDASLCPGFSQNSQDTACYELDLSKPTFNKFDGGMSVSLSAIDVYGNYVVQNSSDILVTRLKWTKVIAGGSPVQALAVASDGALFAGNQTSVTKLLPGVPLSSFSTGNVQSLAVSESYVFAAYNTSGGGASGHIDAFDPTTFMLQSGGCAGATGSNTYSGIALHRPSSGLATYGVGSFNAVNQVSNPNGFGCMARPASTPLIFQQDSSTLDSFSWSSNSLPAAVNIAVHAGKASFLANNTFLGALGGCIWEEVDLGNPNATPESSQLTGLGVACVGQAVRTDAFLISSKQAAGDQVFLRADAGSEGGTLGGVTADRGVPSVASIIEAYLGQGSALVRFNPSDLDAGGVGIGAALSGESVRTAPVLGDEQDGGVAAGYAISDKGTLIAFTHSNANSVELWRSKVLDSSDTIASHMAFDRNRSNCASKTGILYLGTASGNVTAIIVDSPRLLDKVGAWPKYQRTMGNAGNDDSFFPINWPSCP